MTHPLADLVAQIPHPAFRKLTERALEKAPAAFWTAPASTSGKYHPADSLGRGGLVRHTRKVFRLTLDLLNMLGIEPDNTRHSIALSAALLHDTWKVTDEADHSNFEHPLRAAENVGELLAKEFEPDAITTLAGSLLCQAIRSHMGRWTTSKHSTFTLPAPESQLDHIVHTADYLASRKHITLLPET